MNREPPQPEVEPQLEEYPPETIRRILQDDTEEDTEEKGDNACTESTSKPS